MIEGDRYYFEDGGIYNGFSLIRDRETQSLWHHATGEALHGKLKGKALAQSENIYQMTAEQAVRRYPKAQLALSRDSSFTKKLIGMLSERVYAPDKGGIPMPPLRRFLDPMDKRLPQMEIGLGVWFEDQARFYPRTAIQESDRAIIDTLGDRRLVIYIDPQTHTPTACVSNALAFWWKNDVLHFNNGSQIRNGILYDANGKSTDINYPRQLFTRWYGFAYTFPNCSIYNP